MPQEYETLRQENDWRAKGSPNSGSKYPDYNAVGAGDHPRDAKDLETGGHPLDGNGEAAATKMDKSAKLGFVRKVNIIVSLQLLLTIAVSALCVMSETVRGLVQQNEWTLYVGVGFSTATLIGLQVFQNMYPANVYVLVAWTVSVAGTVGVLCAMYTTRAQGIDVLESEGLALVMSLTLVLLTLQKKLDVVALGMVLPIGGLTLVLLWGFFLDTFALKLNYCYSLFGGLLFSFWVGLKTAQNSRVLKHDEYIVASIYLYLHVTIGILVLVKTCFIDFVTCRFRGCGSSSDVTEFGDAGAEGDGGDGY